MNHRTKTQFKLWQPLPALATGRTDCLPQSSPTRACDLPRPGNSTSAAGRTPAVRKAGAGSPTLKFIFTTHD
jgi:hypothetical protein